MKPTYILCLIWVTALLACNKDFVRLQPQDLIADNQVYASHASVQALVAALYDDLSGAGYEDFTYGQESNYISVWTDEAVQSYTWSQPSIIGTIPNGQFGNWWPYDVIRRQNDFIAKIVNATSLEAPDRNQYLQEVRFLRALTYFGLVKRYGGVPLVTKVLTTADDLKIPRSTEQQIYDFVAGELDDIIGSNGLKANGPLRVTNAAALALKCRAMLYAASEAKYGHVQLNGLVGIPSSMANTYWQKAYDAARAIVALDKFKLFQGNSDPARNFQLLFNSRDATTNPEAILAEAYSLPNRGHGFDYYNSPQSFRVDYGNSVNPVLELVEEFEYTDGTPGKLKIVDDRGKPIRYNNPADLFIGKDPRFFASILYPGAEWHANKDPQGGYIELRRGIVNGTDTLINEDQTKTYGAAPYTITFTGKDGPTTTADPTKSGFYQKKYLVEDANFTPNDGQSQQPWLVFRYGEVLLNFAEAAVELGKPGDALSAINQIRARAGIKLLSAVNLSQVRHERRVELAFENHRYWDLRRWHIADQVLNATTFRALFPWLNWKANTNPAQMQYTFTIAPIPVKPGRTFPPRLYYEQIDVSGANSYLVQNPGY